ncbi:MAG: divergent polysaccharide deacetylase family protein [Sneathiella sp.]
MRNSKIKKNEKPAAGKRPSVLTVLYSLLILSVAGLVGWLYWQGLQTEQSDLPSAILELAGPVPTPPNEAGTEEKPAPAPTAQKEDPVSEPEPKQDAEKKSATSEQAPIETPEKPQQVVEEVPEKSEEEPAEIPLQSSAPTDSEELAPSPDNESDVKIDTAEKNDEQPQSPTAEKKEDPQEKDIKQPEEKAVTAEESQKPAELPTDVPAAEQKPAKPESIKPAQAAKAKPPVFAEESVRTQQEPLPPVPDPELTRKSDYGLLPVIGPTGRLPWRIYGKPFEDPLDRPRIAIIISEMGMSKTATRSAIQNLPGSVTLSFNPYARGDLQNWIEQARAAGHEVLLQLPMEPFGYPKNDPGAQSLLTSLTDKENEKRLAWMLGRFTGYSGVTNQMGSKFTASPDDIRPVLDIIKSRGLLFLDGRTSSKSVAGPLSSQIGIPVAINNRFLDHKADRATIDARLADLERIARYTGTAVGIGYPYPVTLERIRNWTQTLARKGYVLAPVSAVVNRQEIQ